MVEIQTDNGEIAAVIKTLPLTSGNYGGILQAFSLQQVLNAMGLRTMVDTPTKFQRSWRTTPGLIKQALRSKTIDGAISPELRNEVHANTRSFIEEHISTVNLFPGTGRHVDRDLLEQFKIFVSGSDQVWRPAYARVPDYMFEFADDQRAQLYSYAASFGRSDLLEFSPAELERAKRNLSRFSAISVRESNGVSLAEQLGVKAQFVMDPTLLAGREAFEPLVSEEDSTADYVGVLSAMLLDDSPGRRRIVRELATRLDLKVRYFYPPKLISKRRYLEARSSFVLPSVGSWLAAVSSSSFIVTDSYHVTLFSMLFETDFVTIGNNSRGLDRFDSILSRVKLRERLCQESDPLPHQLPEIDWSTVRDDLSNFRAHSEAFIKNSILGGTR